MGRVIELQREDTLRRETAAPAQAGVQLVPCRLLAAGEGFAVAETPQGALSCRLAASCLLRPEPGDLALVALPGPLSGPLAGAPAPEGKAVAYILAVLERGEAQSPARLDLPTGAVIAAPGGQVQIEAAQGISLSTPAELSASAGSMSFAAGGVRWLAEAFSYVGKSLEFITQRFTETSVERDTQADTWTQRLGDSFRHVEELDETQAGMVRTLAKDTALLHGRVTYVQAEEFVKADGQEVHLG